MFDIIGSFIILLILTRLFYRGIVGIFYDSKIPINVRLKERILDDNVDEYDGPAVFFKGSMKIFLSLLFFKIDTDMIINPSYSLINKKILNWVLKCLNIVSYLLPAILVIFIYFVSKKAA